MNLKRKGVGNDSNPLQMLVFASGFEPLAYRLGGGRSILLSYANIQPRHYSILFSYNKVIPSTHMIAIPPTINISGSPSAGAGLSEKILRLLYVVR